jgi:hypothetical protein
MSRVAALVERLRDEADLMTTELAIAETLREAADTLECQGELLDVLGRFAESQDRDEFEAQLTEDELQLFHDHFETERRDDPFAEMRGMGFEFEDDDFDADE